MSVVKDVDGIRFTFPADWRALKYDDSSFHRNQFQGLAGGSKALDLVAMAPDRTLWLIEAKDYGRHRRQKAGSVFAEVASKLRATLAGLATARVRANEPAEQTFADAAMRSTTMRVALHLNQAARQSRLFPQAIDPKSATLQLRREVHAIDPHPICYGRGVGMNPTPWTTHTL